MQEEILIQNLDDIQPAIERLLSDYNNELRPIIAADFTLSIKLKGKTWDGLVDIRVANYVTELQRTLDRARRDIALDTTDKPLVKVLVKDGSTELEAKVADIIQNMLNNMTSQQQFIALLTLIGCGLGGWSLKKILDWLSARQKANLEHQEKLAATTQTGDAFKEMNETLRYTLERLDPEKPVRTLVKGMAEDDTIYLPATSQPLSRDEARARYPRKPRVTPIEVKIDDNYQVASVAVEHPIRLTLERGDLSFKAVLSNKLQPEDREAFVQKVKSVVENGGALRVALHIDASLNDKAVVAAVIVGIGKAPREDAEDITNYFD
jgi:hypothetical protein